MQLELYKQKFEISDKKENQLLASEIYNWFDKKIIYGQILGIIKNKGIKFVRSEFEEAKKTGIDLKLFLWKIKQIKLVKNYEL